MPNRRTVVAVDRAAEEYWKTYFGDYGKQWTRKIPRRVTAALVADLRRAAARSPSAPDDVQVADAAIGLTAVVAGDAGGLVVEGAFRGTIPRAGKPVKLVRAFRAEFDSAGTMTGLVSEAA